MYRPGHTVHFKGVLRVRKPDGYLIPAGRSVNVEVNDSDQKPVYQKTLTVSANGTIHDEITFSPAAALGNYFIQVKSGEGFMSGNFEVQDYKKPEYEVRVTPAKPRVLQGESVQATIDARYYFGEPVSGAKVKYAVYRQRYWFPLWYEPDDESFQPPSPDDSDDAGDQVGEQEGQLDADGKLTINIPTSVSDHKIRLPVSRGRARHRRGQSRDHRHGLGGGDLRELRAERLAAASICTRREAAPRSRCRRAITTTSR